MAAAYDAFGEQYAAPGPGQATLVPLPVGVQVSRHLPI